MPTQWYVELYEGPWRNESACETGSACGVLHTDALISIDY